MAFIDDVLNLVDAEFVLGSGKEGEGRVTATIVVDKAQLKEAAVVAACINAALKRKGAEGTKVAKDEAGAVTGVTFPSFEDIMNSVKGIRTGGGSTWTAEMEKDYKDIIGSAKYAAKVAGMSAEDKKALNTKVRAKIRAKYSDPID